MLYLVSFGTQNKSFEQLDEALREYANARFTGYNDAQLWTEVPENQLEIVARIKDNAAPVKKNGNGHAKTAKAAAPATKGEFCCNRCDFTSKSNSGLGAHKYFAHGGGKKKSKKS